MFLWVGDRWMESYCLYGPWSPTGVLPERTDGRVVMETELAIAADIHSGAVPSTNHRYCCDFPHRVE